MTTTLSGVRLSAGPPLPVATQASVRVEWPPDADQVARRRHRALAATHGRTGVAPFLTAPGAQVVDLLDGQAAASYVRHGRWAVTAGDVISSPACAEFALSDYLECSRGAWPSAGRWSRRPSTRGCHVAPSPSPRWRMKRCSLWATSASPARAAPTSATA